MRLSLQEKDVLLREIHHRVKNNLQVISTLLDFQSAALNDERAREAFRESQYRIHSMAGIHEQLYHSQNLARIEMNTYIHNLVHDLRAAYGANDVAITLDNDDLTLDIETAVPCGLILNELLTNALKHAFPRQAPPPADRPRYTVAISMRAHKQSVKLALKDNGVGISAMQAVEQPRTLGLRLIRMLTRQLSGSLEIQSAPGQGSEFTIIFPLR